MRWNERCDRMGYEKTPRRGYAADGQGQETREANVVGARVGACGRGNDG